MHIERDPRKDWQNFPVELIPTKNDLPGFLYEAFEKSACRRILDLGCGDGRLDIVLGDSGYSVVGFDINPSAIALAKSKLEEEKASLPARIQFLVGDVTALRLDYQPFDAVVCQLLLSIIGSPEDREAVLNTAKSHLKKDGLLYLSASGVSDDINPDYKKLYEADYLGTGERHTYLSRDADGKVLYVTHHFTETELQQLLGKQFTDISITKEKETSSRRKDEAAWFYYVLARAK